MGFFVLLFPLEDQVQSKHRYLYRAMLAKFEAIESHIQWISMQENHLCENKLKFTKHQAHDLGWSITLGSCKEVRCSGSSNKSQAAQDFKELLDLLHNARDHLSSLWSDRKAEWLLSMRKLASPEKIYHLLPAAKSRVFYGNGKRLNLPNVSQYLL